MTKTATIVQYIGDSTLYTLHLGVLGATVYHNMHYCSFNWPLPRSCLIRLLSISALHLFWHVSHKNSNWKLATNAWEFLLFLVKVTWLLSTLVLPLKRSYKIDYLTRFNLCSSSGLLMTTETLSTEYVTYHSHMWLPTVRTVMSSSSSHRKSSWYPGVGLWCVFLVCTWTWTDTDYDTRSHDNN